MKTIHEIIRSQLWRMKVRHAKQRFSRPKEYYFPADDPDAAWLVQSALVDHLQIDSALARVLGRVERVVALEHLGVVYLLGEEPVPIAAGQTEMLRAGSAEIRGTDFNLWKFEAKEWEDGIEAQFYAALKDFELAEAAAVVETLGLAKAEMLNQIGRVDDPDGDIRPRLRRVEDVERTLYCMFVEPDDFPDYIDEMLKEEPAEVWDRRERLRRSRRGGAGQDHAEAAAD